MNNKTKSSDGSSTVVPKRQGLGTRLFTASENSSKSFICTIIIRFSTDDCYFTVFSSAQLSSFGPRSWDPEPLIGTCLIHQVDVLWPNQLLVSSCLHHSVVCWTRTRKDCWGLEALRWRDRLKNARRYLRKSYIFYIRWTDFIVIGAAIGWLSWIAEIPAKLKLITSLEG